MYSFECQNYKGKFLKTGKPKNMSRVLPGFVPSHSDEIDPLMPISSSAESKLFTPEKVELTVNSKKKQMAASNWAKSQEGLLLFTPGKS